MARVPSAGLFLGSRGAAVWWIVLLAVPLAGLFVLLAAPELDVVWEHHPAHFWLVLVAAGINVVLAVATGDAARRRGDARLLLVSLAFLAAAGFLALHALATPGVLLDSPNTGFVVATPVGLLAASALAVASSLRISRATSVRLARRSRLFHAAVLAVLAAWAVVSLTERGPLAEPLPPDEAEGPLLALALPGVALYLVATARYLGVLRRRPSAIVLAVATAYALLAEAMLAIAFARNWHATWWEWHLLMLVAFALVAWSARREWHEERFADLYLPETAGSTRDLTVLFADLEGYTRFSERASPEEVAHLVNTYFERTVPLVAARFGGDVRKLIGDAIMVSFDQPDHPERAARAAAALQRDAAEVARAHPGWPRFRVGVHSGDARVGIVGAAGKRQYDVVGDTVNLAARLEGLAPVGGIVVSAETYSRLPDGTRVEPLGGVRVKGKEAPVEAYVLVGLPPDREESEQPLDREHDEAGDDRDRR